MQWMATPVTIPAGVIVLFFSMFAGIVGTLLRFLHKMWLQFFTQQVTLLKALNVADRSTAIAEKTVDAK